MQVHRLQQPVGVLLDFPRSIPLVLGLFGTLRDLPILAAKIPDHVGTVDRVTSGVVGRKGHDEYPRAGDLHPAIGMQEEPEVIPRPDTQVQAQGSPPT